VIKNERVALHQKCCMVLLWISISGFESLGGSQITGILEDLYRSCLLVSFAV
jgi:hypothetical protein